MTRRAWTYIWAILVLGIALDGLAVPGLDGTTTAARLTCAVLVGAATLAQLRTARVGGHAVLHLTTVFVFAGVLLLPPSLVVPLVVVPSLVAWTQEQRRGRPHERLWWTQPFNIAMYTVMAFGAKGVDALLTGAGDTPTFVFTFASPGAALAAAVAAVAFVALNYAVGGLFLIVAKGLSWRDTGLLERDNLAIELSLVGLGCVVAALWRPAPWFVPAVFSPIVLMDRALAVPQLKRDAQVDAKTGLAGARHFDTLFTAELDRARRFARPLALLMADLDRFKVLNDTHGHLAGDAVLAGVGRVLRASLREYDIAGRFGGEEFAIALPETDPAAARALAERIRRAVAAERFAVPCSPTPLRATLSIGVASFPHDGATPTDLTRAADAAAYRAKAAGRDRVICATDMALAPEAARDYRPQSA